MIILEKKTKRDRVRGIKEDASVHRVNVMKRKSFFFIANLFDLQKKSRLNKSVVQIENSCCNI